MASERSDERVPDDKAPPADGEKPREPRRVRLQRWARRHPRGAALAGLLLVAALVGAVLVWRWHHSFEDTDDAQIDGHIASVGARVGATVVRVLVEENQAVAEGQLLALLDDADYRVALANAEAQLARAEAELAAGAPQVPITQAQNANLLTTTAQEVEGARDTVANAEHDRDAAAAAARQAAAEQLRAAADHRRAEYLLRERAIPRERYDALVATDEAARAALDSARARARAAAAVVEQQRHRLEQAESRRDEAQRNTPRTVVVQRASQDAREAAVRAARAAVDRARLDLTYCRVVAPFAGVIGRRSVEPGMRVATGQELFALVDVRDVWVTANFKETQLRRLRVGQTARIHVDAIDRDFRGAVESFGAASGARFSLLPPENATGNYVKVVQRIPVRLRLQRDQPGAERLRPGMSVEPKVWIR